MRTCKEDIITLEFLSWSRCHGHSSECWIIYASMKKRRSIAQIGGVTCREANRSVGVVLILFHLYFPKACIKFSSFFISEENFRKTVTLEEFSNQN